MEQRKVRGIFSIIGFAFVAFMGIQMVLVQAIALWVNAHAPQIAETGWYTWVLAYAPLYLVAFPAFLAIMRLIPDSEGGGCPEPVRLSVRDLLMLVVVSIGIVYPLNILTMLVSTLVESIRGSGITNPLQEVVMGSNPWINILFVAVIAPIMEEIIFRRILYKKLIRFGGAVYVVFSAFVFALFHANIYQLIYAFLLGVLFAGLTYFTGTIRYSVLLHIVINFIGSGVGPLLMHYAGEMALALWGMAIILMVIVGLVLGIVWLVRNRRKITFTQGEVQVEDKSALFFNPGVIVYMFIVLVMIIATLMI